MVSPRLGPCVFVLIYPLLLEVLHCLVPLGLWNHNRALCFYLRSMYWKMFFKDKQENNLFVVKSVSYQDDGTFCFSPDPIPVIPLTCDETTDIVVLKAQSPFSDAISLCPLGEFPLAENEDRVKTYHCPCQLFPADLSIISQMSTDYNKLRMESAHHYYISGDHIHGSSGGVVVDKRGRAVALICSGCISWMEFPLSEDNLGKR